MLTVEFGGVRLYSPPSGVGTLVHHRPSLVAFLTESGATDLPDDAAERARQESAMWISSSPRSVRPWRVICAVLVVPLVLAMAACTGGTTRAYLGPQRPPGETALLKHQTGFGMPSVYFVSINNTPVVGREFQYGELELLPGSHEVEFGFESAQARSTENAKVRFVAKANREYEARAYLVPPETIWGAIARATIGGRGQWTGVIVELGPRPAGKHD